MKILFVNAYFYPEVIAFSHLEEDLIDGLLEAGHTIEVICPVPTRGVSRETVERYKNKKIEKLKDGKVTVRRFWAPQEAKNPIIRAFRYFWCNIREYQIGRRYKDVDAIFAVSTPPTQGLLAGVLSKKLKCPFVYSLQDVFPDSLVTTGMTKEGSLLWKLGRKIENATYKRADKIIVISNSFKKNITDKNVPQEKIEIISNWIDTAATKPVSKEENRLFDEFGISRDGFTVVYAGNFGAAQGADVVLAAAERLKENPSVRFVIFGGGSGFEEVKKQAQQKQLSNLIVNGLLPQERVPEVYSLGDVALITCKKGVGNSGMPSKTWSIMACDTPIIAAFDTDSELAEILAQSGAGICVEPQNAEALAVAIESVANGEKKLRGGREFVRNYAEKNICVEKYVDIIKNL